MNELYRLIHAEKATYPIVLLCRVLKVARSSYYAWCEGEAARRARQTADDALAHEIIVLHVASRKTYGVPRIHAELRRLCWRVNRKRVARVMRERDIRGVTRRRRRSLTRPDLKAKPAPDLEAVAMAINNRPRKVLGWRTPAEVFEEQLRSLQQPGVATTS